MLKWANNSESERNLTNTIKLATSDAELITNYKMLDANIWQVATADGQVIDLTNGLIREITPTDYLTKSLGTIYSPKAKCPLWEKFLMQIMGNDKELVAFLQRTIGYCLTGSTTEQILIILHGTGANGKSTFLNALLALFGDYGKQAAPQTFMAQKFDNQIRSDLMRLNNIRFIATSESESYHRLNESMVKSWTGGEQVVTRDLYQKTSEFTPRGKIWLATNHKPKIYGTDHAVWRRIISVPFNRTFRDDEKDYQSQ